ncbi:MAG: hypothetical protein ACI97K_001208 [Glaciecola sp.]|jgi:hypothetical protein
MKIGPLAISAYYYVCKIRFVLMTVLLKAYLGKTLSLVCKKGEVPLSPTPFLFSKQVTR